MRMSFHSTVSFVRQLLESCGEHLSLSLSTGIRTFGMQGFDTAVQTFDRSGILADIHDRDSCFSNLFGRSTRGQDLYLLTGQKGGKFDNARLVRNRNQGSSNGYHIGGVSWNWREKERV